MSRSIEEATAADVLALAELNVAAYHEFAKELGPGPWRAMEKNLRGVARLTGWARFLVVRSLGKGNVLVVRGLRKGNVLPLRLGTGRMAPPGGGDRRDGRSRSLPASARLPRDAVAVRRPGIDLRGSGRHSWLRSGYDRIPDLAGPQGAPGLFFEERP